MDKRALFCHSDDLIDTLKNYGTFFCNLSGNLRLLIITMYACTIQPKFLLDRNYIKFSWNNQVSPMQ